MNNNTKLEIAIEIMSAKIAKMYQFDEKTIDKIINIYGKEIK